VSQLCHNKSVEHNCCCVIFDPPNLHFFMQICFFHRCKSHFKSRFKTRAIVCPQKFILLYHFKKLILGTVWTWEPYVPGNVFDRNHMDLGVLLTGTFWQEPYGPGPIFPFLNQIEIKDFKSD
jgi:hypothetical protein